MKIVGLSGVTNGGKSTLAAALKHEMEEDGWTVRIVPQDDFFRPDEQEDFDREEAIDMEAFRQAVRSSSQTLPDLLIVEGFLLFQDKELRELCTERWFLTLERDVCQRRRSTRTDYVPPDYPGYFEGIVWPRYEEHLQVVRSIPGIQFLDGAVDQKQTLRTLAISTRRLLSRDWIRVSTLTLSAEEATKFVTEPETGASSLFLGTTRNTFDGKVVVRLEYEAYVPMARKSLSALAESLRQRWPSIARIALLHRLGEVPVCEASVAIAISSPHRADSLAAVTAAIDEVKSGVPIWKKECFLDETGLWKENQECPWSS